MEVNEMDLNEKENLSNSIRFLDGASKSMDGLREKYSLLLNDVETRNEKPNDLLKNWIDQSEEILKEKFSEIFNKKYEVHFQNTYRTWLSKYKDNQEFMMNAKIFLKSLQFIRSTVKMKINSKDQLASINITENLINKKNN